MCIVYLTGIDGLYQYVQDLMRLDCSQRPRWDRQLPIAYKLKSRTICICITESEFRTFKQKHKCNNWYSPCVNATKLFLEFSITSESLSINTQQIFHSFALITSTIKFIWLYNYSPARFCEIYSEHGFGNGVSVQRITWHQ